jgi:hypothetical protein
MSPIFDHEKLQAYQQSLAFVAWVEPILQKLPKTTAVRDQLDRASTSIPLNLAEGNGNSPLRIVAVFLTSRAAPLWSVPRRWMFWPPRAYASWLWSPLGRSGCGESFRC